MDWDKIAREAIKAHMEIRENKTDRARSHVGDYGEFVATRLREIAPAVDMHELATKVCKIVCAANSLPGHDVASFSTMPIGPVQDELEKVFAPAVDVDVEKLASGIEAIVCAESDDTPKDVKLREYIRRHLSDAGKRIAELEAQLSKEATAIHLMLDAEFGAIQENTKLRAERDKLREAKDTAYAERNKMVAFLSGLYPSHMKRHPESDTEWEDDWRNIVCVHGPAGQMTWHIHDSECYMYAHLNVKPDPFADCEWDGHTTDEKYQRLYGCLARAALSESKGGDK